MADKKISELDLALLINDDAEFPISQDNAGDPTTFKGRITQLGTKIAEDMTFSNLRTTSKKLVGAINELLSLGNPIILGTSAPTSSQGANGNLYIQYTAGTGGADDEVDGIFVKIDGAWCEIQTGGGSGTTDYEDLSNKPQVNSVELVGNKSLDDLGIMPASLSKTVSGSIAHFTDGADNIPVKSLTSEIVAVQSGSGTPSPSNPRAISGFDSGVVTVTDNDQITNTYTFAFGQTVYGGYFDNKGNLVVTYGFIDLSTLSWSGGTYNIFEANINDIKPPQTPSERKTGILCNTYPVSVGTSINNTMTDKSMLKNSTVLYIRNTDYSTPSDFSNSLNGVYLAYELANPITLAITSQDIPTLLGENNIFSNTGDVEVDYYTDKADEIVEVSKATASTPLHSYSTDEQVVGTWIDGKTLYEKTVDCGALPDNSNKQVAHGISNIDKIVNVVGIAYSTSLGTAVQLAYPSSNSTFAIDMSVNNTYIVFLTFTDRTSFNGYVTIRYTKLST